MTYLVSSIDKLISPPPEELPENTQKKHHIQSYQY